MQTIRKGYKSEAVKVLQRRLGLTVDGVFGTKTDEAVKAFQRKSGLKVDGIVGAKTWAALGYGSTSSPVGGGSGVAGAPLPGGPVIDKVLSVVVLYGIFKVLQKAF